MSEREAVEAVIDLDLECLSPAEIEGGFRSLCGAMLLRTTQELGIKDQPRKQSIEAKRTARRWLFRDVGLITFTDACDACDMDKGRILSQIVEYSDRLKASPRSPNCVFGREPTRLAGCP